MKRALLGFVVGVVCTVAVLLVLISGSRSAEALSGQAYPMTQAAPEAEASMAEDGLGMRGVGEGGGGYGAALGGLEEAQKSTRRDQPRAVPAAPKGAPAEEREADEPSEGGEVTATRSWFPETFLFEPLVVTNEAGEATVPVKIPDRLTRWRVLALAHSRTGEQSGAVASFQGTLPVYVEPVLPGFLVAGDEVRLPIQVVNTTEREVSGALTLTVEGASLVENPSGRVQVPAGGTLLRYAILRAGSAGQATIRARFGEDDALVKELPVAPAGRPWSVGAGGTLAAPRQVPLALPAQATAENTRVRLTVFPGALAVLRNELGAAALRGGPADDAYGLLLAGRAQGLLENLGEQADPEVLRRATVVLQQRALRHTRTADGPLAALFAEAALAHPQNAVLARLGQRLSQTVAATQRPDGTFHGGDGWPLQRLLVATAEGTRAVAAGKDQRGVAVSVRSAGAFERYLSQVQDGYTAAAILASGAASGEVSRQLKEKVIAALVSHSDGSRSLPVEAGVSRGDGQRPSQPEATALAILALAQDPQAPVADLGAYLLGNYSPHFGWGDGRTNLVALQAVLQVFRQPLPSQVRVVLEHNGRVVTEGTFAAANTRDVVSMEALAPASLAEAGQWTVRAEPAVPGLGYRLELTTWLPWKQETANGLELAVVAPAKFKVGEAATVQLSAAGPAGVPWSLKTALPAGVQVDRPALDAAKASGELLDYTVEDGAVTLQIPARGPGQPFVTSLRVFPTLGGRLNATASSLAVEGRPEWTAYAPTPQWSVQP